MEPSTAMSIVINSYDVNRTWNLIDVSFCRGKITCVSSAQCCFEHWMYRTHFHPGGLLPPTNGIVFKGELVLSDDRSAVFVSNVCHNIHIRGPHLKLSLPVNDCGERCTNQERPLGVALKKSSTSSIQFCYLTIPTIKMFYGLVANTKVTKAISCWYYSFLRGLHNTRVLLLLWKYEFQHFGIIK